MSSTPNLPNGSAEVHAELTSLPPVVGINFGNSYASIAVFTKDGHAECIANEDGERQIACAISFHGEEMYIGNQAKHQLVKNSKNTITGFRNILGRKFSEIPQSELNLSAPVIQHPDLPDTPAYKVDILQPAPTPLPASAAVSIANTPAASKIPTPRSEPIPAERILTASEVTTIFLKCLIQSAEAFLGKKVRDAVITVPSWFTDTQKDALEKAATDTGVHVLQLLDEAGAATVITTTETWSSQLQPDRTQLVVDVGASSTAVTLLSIREGLAYVLASSSTSNAGGDRIDDKLIKFFAGEFTKKMKLPLNVVPATDVQDKRAEAKLRLALEHTKRTISASPGAAACSVESLKDGIDYTGSINRMRFDLVARPVYVAVADAITKLLETASIDPHDVDEIVYVGGTTCLPGLDEHLILSCGFREDVESPFARGTIVGGGVGDPTTILARGCAIQAQLVSAVDDDELRRAFGRESKANEVKALTRTLGVLLPSSSGSDSELGGTWIPVVQKESALPVRRKIRVDVELSKSNKVVLEVWEVREGIRIEKVKPPKVELSDGEIEEDEEEEEVEVKHRTVSKETFLGLVELDARLGIEIKGRSEAEGKTTTTLDIQFVVSIDADLDVSVSELGEDGASAQLSIAGS